MLKPVFFEFTQMLLTRGLCALVQFFIQYLIADASLKFAVPSLKPKRPIPWDIYLAQVAPVGVAMGLDIGHGRKGGGWAE